MQPSSIGGPSKAFDRKKTSASRRATLELVRIYVAAAAFSAARDALDQLPENDWDDEAHLLRAEASIGMGQLSEAAEVLGAVSIPRQDPVDAQFRRERGGSSAELSDPNLSEPSRREHLGLWRFLLQLRVLHRQAEYEQVLQLGRAFLGADPFGNNTILARIVTVIAQSMMAVRRPAEARSLYDDVLTLYKRARSKEGIADTVLGIANTHLLDCHWDEADALYQESRYRYEDLGQSDKALAAQINLGILRTKRGDVTGGRALLEHARQRCEEIGQSSRMSSIDLGLALAHNKLGEFETARFYLRNVIRVARSPRKPRLVGLALEFLGEGYLREGRFDKAERTLQLGLRIAVRMSPRGDIAFEIRRCLAEVALLRGDLSLARKLANQADIDAGHYGDEFERAVIQRVLAQVDKAEGNVRSAKHHCEIAKETLGRLGETHERAIVERFYRELSQPQSHAVRQAFAIGPEAASELELATARDEERVVSEKSLAFARALGIVTQDRRLLETLFLAQQAAKCSASVLILAERGSESGRLARLIHEWSDQSGLYLPVHCTDVPPGMMEVDLFGSPSVPGGVFAASAGGTLLLDHLAALAPSVQRRLSAELEQERAHRPRIVSAIRVRSEDQTIPRLLSELQHQLQDVRLVIPALRKRPDDIPLQIELFLEQARLRFNEKIESPPRAWVDACRRHDWPGNVQELRQAVETYVAKNRE